MKSNIMRTEIDKAHANIVHLLADAPNVTYEAWLLCDDAEKAADLARHIARSVVGLGAHASREGGS